MSFEVKIGRNDGARDLAKVHEQLASPDQRTALMKAVGVRGEQEIKNWFIRRDADSPNKMGWPRQHFWARLSRATAFDAGKTTEDQATVVVSDPALAAKIAGATIRAGKSVSPITGKLTRNIAIPMNAEAYGKMPRGNPIPGLFFIRKTGGNGGFLVTAEGKGKDRKLTFFYRLLPEITVPKDPRALPPADELGAALGETALQFFRRNVESTGGEN